MAASSPLARPRCVAWRARASSGGRLSAFQAKTIHIHHAGIRIPGRGRVDDQFPSAALDVVYAGLRLWRLRSSESGLCSCCAIRIQILFLWRCEPAFPDMKSFEARMKALWRDDPTEASMTSISARRRDEIDCCALGYLRRLRSRWRHSRPFILRRNGEIDFGSVSPRGGEPTFAPFASASAFDSRYSGMKLIRRI